MAEKRLVSYDPHAVTPKVGDRGVWVSDKRHPRRVTGFPPNLVGPERVTVVRVKWNGEEWWIQTSGGSGLYWNDLDVYNEHVIPEQTYESAPAQPRGDEV